MECGWKSSESFTHVPGLLLNTYLGLSECQIPSLNVKTQECSTSINNQARKASKMKPVVTPAKFLSKNEKGISAGVGDFCKVQRSSGTRI